DMGRDDGCAFVGGFSCIMSGLRFCSNRAIPHAIQTTDAKPSDVHVKFGLLPDWHVAATRSAAKREQEAQPASPGASVRKQSLNGVSFFEIAFADETLFVLSESGDEVWAAWPDSLTFEDTVTYLQGPILGCLLRIRGLQVLHASAVEVHGQGVALLGGAGFGK